MAKIQKFEEIKSWQKAREIANQVYDLTNQGAFANDFELKNQIRRSAGSIMHNIAEGFDSGSNREFIRFLHMSRRSASEVQSQLYLAMDLGYINESKQTTLHLLCVDVKRLINGLIKYLKTTPNRIE